MERLYIHSIAAAIMSAAAVGDVFAEGGKNQQILGLWQSGETYLELNLDGTFFYAQQSEQDDVFGTFIVKGDVVRFTYGLGDTVLTTQNTVHFSPAGNNAMRLVDSQRQSVQYRKLRDF